MSILNAPGKWLTNYYDRDSVGSRLRRRRLQLLRPMVDEAFARYGRVNIIDIGGTRLYWNIVERAWLDAKNIHITLVNLPGTGQGPAGDDSHFTHIQADGCDLSMLESKSYHIAHSNSVIEHIPGRARQESFAGEIDRLGMSYFVQTPNFWFPLEPHSMVPFFHWLPRRCRLWLVRHFQLGHWARAGGPGGAAEIIDSAQLLDRARFAALFPGATIHTERLLGLAKSYIAVKPCPGCDSTLSRTET